MVKKRSTSLILAYNFKITKRSVLSLDEYSNSVMIKLKYMPSNPFFKFNYIALHFIKFIKLYQKSLTNLNLCNVPFIRNNIFKKHKFFKNSFMNAFYLDSDYIADSSVDYTPVSKLGYVYNSINLSNKANSLMSLKESRYNDKIVIPYIEAFKVSKLASEYLFYSNFISIHKFINYLTILQRKDI